VKFDQDASKVIILSGIEKDSDIQTIYNICKKLGDAKIEDAYEPGKTTHIIVCKPAKRTIKVLAGIAEGVWVISMDWVTRSLEEKKWLKEEEFDIDEFPGAKLSRKAHQAKKDELFKGVSFFINGPTASAMPTSHFKTLIISSGGKISNRLRDSDYCITKKEILRDEEDTIKVVVEGFVLDSISNFKVMNYENYDTKKINEADAEKKKQSKSKRKISSEV